MTQEFHSRNMAKPISNTHAPGDVGRVMTEVLFTIGKAWKCLTVEEWVNELCTLAL